MKKINLARLCAALFSFAATAHAVAQTAVVPASASAPASSANGFGKPVALDLLASSRGGTETINNDMRLAGTTSGNTATNVATGSNSISAGSFANMTGLPVVIQNSGANVLIQNATILNLQIN